MNPPAARSQGAAVERCYGAGMRRYLVTTGALFALLGGAHWLRTFAEWQRLTDEPGFIVEGPGIGAIASVLAVWAWRLHRSLAASPGG